MTESKLFDIGSRYRRIEKRSRGKSPTFQQSPCVFSDRVKRCSRNVECLVLETADLCGQEWGVPGFAIFNPAMRCPNVCSARTEFYRILKSNLRQLFGRQHWLTKEEVLRDNPEGMWVEPSNHGLSQFLGVATTTIRDRPPMADMGTIGK